MDEFDVDHTPDMYVNEKKRAKFPEIFFIVLIQYLWHSSSIYFKSMEGSQIIFISGA